MIDGGRPRWEGEAVAAEDICEGVLQTSAPQPPLETSGAVRNLLRLDALTRAVAKSFKVFLYVFPGNFRSACGSHL